MGRERQLLRTERRLLEALLYKLANQLRNFALLRHIRGVKRALRLARPRDEALAAVERAAAESARLIALKCLLPATAIIHAVLARLFWLLSGRGTPAG